MGPEICEMLQTGLDAMGANGRRFYGKELSLDRGVRKYEKILESVAKKPPGEWWNFSVSLNRPLNSIICKLTYTIARNGLTVPEQDMNDR